MMMFGGSPTRVAVPPMFEAIASATRYGTTGTSRRSHTRNVTGAMSSTVVTLSSAAEATAVTTTSVTITRNGLPRACFTARIATYSKTPVRFRTPTMSIIPSSRKMTFQSMPASGEKNACSASVAPTRRRTTAPPRATFTRWIFSVAMRTYAAVKTTTATQAMPVTARAPARAVGRG